ncbi:hypothetical protein GCM10027093_11250 [Paraburkholderia jirisanensis]
MAAFPDNVVATICCCNEVTPEKKLYTRMPFRVELEANGAATYLVHPQPFPRVDVAVIPLRVDEPHEMVIPLSDGTTRTPSLPPRDREGASGVVREIECIQDMEAAFLEHQPLPTTELWLGDDLFILGYPRALSDLYGQPLWKRATVASSPELGKRVSQFLVDCASREGMSGAPVVSYNRLGFSKSQTAFPVGMPTTVFRGIYTSRVGKTDDFEAQIGTVWQRHVVDEIIDRNLRAPLSESILATNVEIEAAIEDSWKTDSDFVQRLTEGAAPLDLFVQIVMRRLEGRADPAEIRLTVLEKARRSTG